MFCLQKIREVYRVWKSKHRCRPLNFDNILRTPYSWNICNLAKKRNQYLSENFWMAVVGNLMNLFSRLTLFVTQGVPVFDLSSKLEYPSYKFNQNMCEIYSFPVLKTISIRVCCVICIDGSLQATRCCDNDIPILCLTEQNARWSRRDFYEARGDRKRFFWQSLQGVSYGHIESI
jgi:hypothetical protein